MAPSSAGFSSLTSRQRTQFGLADFGIAVGQATDPELMQVIVPPTEGRLDDAVKLAEVEAARDDQAAPDRRLDLRERDTDLERIRFLKADAGEYAGSGDN